MASSPLNVKSHVRSNSFPYRPHPLISQIDDHLCTLKSSSSSITNKVNGLTDLYDLVKNLLLLPHTQHTLTQECNEKLIDGVLNGSLKLIDVCGTTKDVLLHIKEDTQELQSLLRRRRGDESKLLIEVGYYLSSRKKENKAIRKSFRDLKSSSCTLSSLEDQTINLLREVEGVTMTVFESTMFYISGRKSQSKPSGWSLVSKLMNSKPVACEAEATILNEFEKVNAILRSLIENKSRKSSIINADNAQIALGNLESYIQDLEEGMESLFRRLIKTRVSLLNILNH